LALKYTQSDGSIAAIQSGAATPGQPKSRRKSKRGLYQHSRWLKAGFLAGNFLILGIFGSVVLGNKITPDHRSLAYAPLSNNISTNPLDLVSASDIASTVAKMTNLPETTAVINQAQSTDAASVSSVTGSDSITSKPLVVATALKSKADIISYTAKSGDTISSLAQKFNVTSDSIRWSNNLTGNSVIIGTQLDISPISNGLVYTVKNGDTPDSLAQKFHANKDKIVAFNDAELKGLIVGDHALIPDGTVIPAAAISTFAAVGTGFAFGGNLPIYSQGATGYDFGQCTYWAALRRSQIGSPIPSNLGNAVTWLQLAQLAGLNTGNVPRKGAVIWTPPSKLSSIYAQYGHVGFVEDVLPDGRVKVSDMNVKGWDVLSSRTLTPESAAEYSYIY
jgi:surface antigen/LysM repeat protein